MVGRVSGLRRTLGVTDAVVIGAGSMIGAGVFVAWSPAADAAGGGLLLGLVVAAVVALCNATSSAQLVARYPESGGTYVYARERLGPGWGHLAGWGFVVGKTASCSAMAQTVGAYAAPGHPRAVAVAVVVAVTAVNLGGLSRTVAVTKVLLAVTSTALVAVLVSGWAAGSFDLGRIDLVGTAGWPDQIGGVLRSAGILFFAFAGYARIATLGEEVRDPATTIPRAIPLALGAVLVLYLVVGATTLAVLPADVVASSDAPLRAVVEAGRWEMAAPVVRVGAVIASMGVLLNLVPGVSRTVLAMARRSEMPSALADLRDARPIRAELTVAFTVVVVTLLVDLRDSIALSGVAVLVYYAITNAAALRLGREERIWPRPVAVLGFVGCVVLAGSLPPRAVVTGSILLLVGAGVRRIGSDR